MNDSRFAKGANSTADGVTVFRDQRIPTRDPGVTLSADVYLPAQIADSVPALVTVVPYRKDLTGRHLQASLMHLAGAGYGCILADLGGTGASDGSPRPKFDPGDGLDALRVVEWAASQPWCNGKVGMWGQSAGGFISLRTAALRPPALKAVIAIQTPTDPGFQAIHHDGARVDLHQRALWGGQMLVQQLLPPLDKYEEPASQLRWRARLRDAEPFLIDLCRSPDDPIWTERAIDLDPIQIPTFLVAGWLDPYAQALIQAYAQLSGTRKLLVGPWAHSLPDDSPYCPIDFQHLATRWWDHWLRDIDTGIMREDPVLIRTMGAEPEWKSYPTWPPPTDRDEIRLRAHGHSLVRHPEGDPPAGHDAEEWSYIPDPTIGTLGAFWGIPTAALGLPLDQHDDDMRSLCWTSEPVQSSFLLAGSAELNLSVSVPEDRANVPAPFRLVARLTDVDPDGRSNLIAAGVVTWTSTRTEDLSITIRPAAYRIPSGHRIRVGISDADFPRLTPIPDIIPIRVARVQLNLPNIDPNGGQVATVPAIKAVPVNAPEREGRWSITRDPILEAVSVRFGWASPATYTQDGHKVEVDADIHAFVTKDAPGAAITTGVHTANARMRTGETIRVRALVRCTQTNLWAEASLVVDDSVVHRRQWDRELTHRESAEPFHHPESLSSSLDECDS